MEGRGETSSSLNQWLMHLKILQKYKTTRSPAGVPPRALAVACVSEDPDSQASLLQVKAASPAATPCIDLDL